MSRREKMTTPDHAPVLGTKGVPKPGIGSNTGNALLAFCAGICRDILKEIGEAVRAVVRFVLEVLAETIIELRWILLIGLSLMGLLWFWLQNPHMRRPKPYHADPAQGWIPR